MLITTEQFYIPLLESEMFPGKVSSKEEFDISEIQELNEKIDTTHVCTVNMKLQPAAG